MEIQKTKHQTIFKSEDSQGGYEVAIHNDLSQVQIRTGIDEDGYSEEDVFFDVNRSELAALRDMISQLLKC